MKRRLWKRISCGVTAFILALLLCMEVLAAGSARLVRTFVYENTLYTYVELNDVDKPVTQVEAKSATSRFRPRTAGNGAAGRFPITYLLLVDNSNSMPAYKEQLADFCRQMAENSGENTRFILATFGDQFQLINEAVAAKDLEKQFSAIPFDERVTRLHTCIDSALDYFETLPRQGNELRSMIVVSDAVQYDPKGGVPYEELLDRVTHSDVMLHSLGLGDDQDSLERLGKLVQASDGIHQVLAKTLTPTDAADAFFKAGGELLVTGFDLTGCTTSGEDQEVSLTFAANGALVCKGESLVDIPEIKAGSRMEIKPSSAVPAESTAAPEESGEAESTAAPEESGEAESTTAPEESGEAGSTAAPEESSGTGILVMAGAVLLAVVIVLVVVLVRRKNRKSKVSASDGREAVTLEDTDSEPVHSEPMSPESKASETVNPEPEVSETMLSGIYMRIDAGDGIQIPGGTEFTLTGQLMIGRDPSCDIILPEETIPLQAARIWLDSKGVSLEALESQTKVQVNEQPVEGSRVLRSGDCITIDGFTFRLLF
ncbi:MAG: FHA domain-containing protein [Lachnospiraceae bacterium]